MSKESNYGILKFSGLCGFIGIIFYFFLGAGNFIVDIIEGSIPDEFSSISLTVNTSLAIIGNSLLFAIVFFLIGLPVGLVAKRKLARKKTNITLKRAVIIGGSIGLVLMLALALGFIYLAWGVFSSVGDRQVSFGSQLDLKQILSILPFILDGAFTGALIGYASVRTFRRAHPDTI